MSSKRKFVKRAGNPVIAIRLALDTAGFTYQKWGGQQTCKAGDWLVNNNGEIYTVDDETFRRTYKATSAGLYIKVAPVWAEEAGTDGAIRTKEGLTHYKAGDYIVFNDETGSDGYAIDRETFLRMYRPVDPEDSGDSEDRDS